MTKAESLATCPEPTSHLPAGQVAAFISALPRDFTDEQALAPALTELVALTLNPVDSSQWSRDDEQEYGMLIGILDELPTGEQANETVTRIASTLQGIMLRLGSIRMAARPDKPFEKIMRGVRALEGQLESTSAVSAQQLSELLAEFDAWFSAFAQIPSANLAADVCESIQQMYNLGDGLLQRMNVLRAACDDPAIAKGESQSVRAFSRDQGAMMTKILQRNVTLFSGAEAEKCRREIKAKLAEYAKSLNAVLDLGGVNETLALLLRSSYCRMLDDLENVGLVASMVGQELHIPVLKAETAEGSDR